MDNLNLLVSDYQWLPGAFLAVCVLLVFVLPAALITWWKVPTIDGRTFNGTILLVGPTDNACLDVWAHLVDERHYGSDLRYICVRLQELGTMQAAVKFENARDRNGTRVFFSESTAAQEVPNSLHAINTYGGQLQILCRALGYEHVITPEPRRVFEPSLS